MASKLSNLITNNTDPNGSLNTDALERAILQYQNTTDPATKLSPAQCVFGSPIKDFIPILPGRYISQPTCSDTLAAREESLRNRHTKEAEQWRVQTGVYHLLQLATTYVFKARQVHIPTSATRQVSSLRSANLTNMSLCVNGSSRIPLRNRKFLRRYVPIQAPKPQHTIHDNFSQITEPPQTCCLTHPVANNLHANYSGIHSATSRTPLAIGPTSTVPTAAAPAHPSSSYPESAVSTAPCPIPEPPPPEAVVEPQQTITNPPPTPVSPSASTPPTPKFQYPMSKTAVALRILMDYNKTKKGLKEQ